MIYTLYDYIAKVTSIYIAFNYFSAGSVFIIYKLFIYATISQTSKDGPRTERIKIFII